MRYQSNAKLFINNAQTTWQINLKFGRHVEQSQFFRQNAKKHGVNREPQFDRTTLIVDEKKCEVFFGFEDLIASTV